MVYVFLAPGYEEIEALTPVDYLRRCGQDVKLVGVGGKTIVGAHQITVTCDCVAEDGMTLPDMAVLPGGMPGTTNLEKSNAVTDCVKACAQAGKWIGAICAAPSVLGHLGLLKGKRAVCFPGFEQELKGAHVEKTPVAIDGKIITSRGAGTANQFAFALAEALCGKEETEKLRKTVQWG